MGCSHLNTPMLLLALDIQAVYILLEFIKECTQYPLTFKPINPCYPDLLVGGKLSPKDMVD